MICTESKRPLSLQTLSIGFLALSAAFRYDEIFANKQIYFLFEKITMAGNSFNTNILIMRSLLNTAGCVFFLSATYSIVTIYQRSKFFHSVVGNIFNFRKQLCKNINWFECILFDSKSKRYLHISFGDWKIVGIRLHMQLSFQREESVCIVPFWIATYVFTICREILFLKVILTRIQTWIKCVRSSLNFFVC